MDHLSGKTCFWFKPKLSREEAIALLQDKPPGTFVVRTSSSYAGAYGLALKVGTPPPGVTVRSDVDLVRHFLIEASASGVQLKGCKNEPIFGSLVAFVYQHMEVALALPCKLILPDEDIADIPSNVESYSPVDSLLLSEGVTTSCLYIAAWEMESLTGPEAVQVAVDKSIQARECGTLTPVTVRFRVWNQGIVLTDVDRHQFFRKHFIFGVVKYCGLDPLNRRWIPSELPMMLKQEDPSSVSGFRLYGFIAEDIVNGEPVNVCHLFAEEEAINNSMTLTIIRLITKQRQELLKTNSVQMAAQNCNSSTSTTSAQIASTSRPIPKVRWSLMKQPLTKFRSKTVLFKKTVDKVDDNTGNAITSTAQKVTCY